MWEESMARVAQEHEELQSRMGESEEKRKRTKKALKEALENATASSRSMSGPPSRMPMDGSATLESSQPQIRELESTTGDEEPSQAPIMPTLNRKPSVLSRISSLYDSESDGDEFFDAIDAGEIEVEEFKESEEVEEPQDESAQARANKLAVVKASFKGYEEPVRERLKMDNDDRPKISLWVSIVERWEV
jgi:hypothetical protein